MGLCGLKMFFSSSSFFFIGSIHSLVASRFSKAGEGVTGVKLIIMHTKVEEKQLYIKKTEIKKTE